MGIRVTTPVERVLYDELTMANPIHRLVCFDLGGVIIRICRTWAEGCAAAGLEVRQPELWRKTRVARRRIIIDYQTGRIDGLTFASRASALVDGLYSPAEILGVHHAWLIDQYQGVAELVDRLHGADVATASLSNTNHEHWSRMGEFPAVLQMRHHLPSHMTGLHKPDPRVFERVEQQLGHHPSEIIFFDDTAENVESALAHGWRAHQIDHDGDTAAVMTECLEDAGIFSAPERAPGSSS